MDTRDKEAENKRPEVEEGHCPECGSELIKRGSEVYCPKCGLVID